jgi:putative flippase GtrA
MSFVPHQLLDLHLFGKHQLAAVLATCVDFGTMIALVELAHLSPPVATIVGAVCGGTTNFAVGRTWAFRDRHTGSLGSQMARYAGVSAGGALLNAALLAGLLAIVPILPYILGRFFVSALVSVSYTYPLHTRFVFRARDLEPAPPAPPAQSALGERTQHHA